jgi:hypothetical protein
MAAITLLESLKAPRLVLLALKSSGPDLFRPGEKTTRLEALYTIANDHLGI